MSDEKEEDKGVHGHNLRSDHHGVLDYMREKMSPKEVEQLVHTSHRDSHGAYFTAHINGEHKTFKLDSNGKIQKAHE